MSIMATGHKLVKEITDQFLHCKICYEPYKDPKTLVCLHTFCVECIQKHVDSDTSRSSRFLLYNRYVTCPLCRSKTEIPTGGVKRLQDNFLVSSLTDVLNRKRISKVPPCEICPGERSKGNNASHKCLDCAKLLCKSCVDLHMTTKVTQHHSLIDIEGHKDIECKNHPEEIVRYYCEPCEECVCVVCTFQEHRDHEICSFSDGFTKYRSGLDGLFSQCKDRLKDVQERLETMQKVEGSLKETRENIRDLAISYIQQVRTTERQLMQRVEEEFGDNIEGFLKNKEWLQENYDNLQTTCNLAEIIMNDKGVEMLLLKKELQNKFSALLEPSLPSVPDNMVKDIKFVPGNVTLGHISLKPDADDDCDGGSVKHRIEDAADGDRPKKRLCFTQNTQTDMSNSVEVSFNIPTTNTTTSIPHKTVTQNGISTDTTGNDTDTNSPVMKTDVSVNTMQSMADFSKSMSGSEECMSPGVCVKCSAELKKGLTSPIGSLPVIDGDAPAIQDIIITNCDENNRSRQRRRRSLIRSRRTQTDLSLSSDSIEDALRVSSQESLNGSFRKYSNQNLSILEEKVVTKSVGLDPIDFGYKYNTMSRNKGVNTTENVKVVVETRSAKTNTPQPQTRESSAMTCIDSRSVDTQTKDKIKVSKCIATDYAGQRNKRTSTPIIMTIDSSTCMPTITQESKVTWTDAVNTTERSVATDVSETTESYTEPMKPQVCDQAIGVKPEMRSVEINTDPLPQLLGADAASASPRLKERKSKTKEKDKKEKAEKSTDKKKKEKKEKREKKKMVDSCTETDPVIRSDKDTGTVATPLKDSWTTTVTPTMVNTGCTPARPATRDAGISTNAVVSMDQGTFTDVIKVVDNATETVIATCEGETLTERVSCQDAETSVDVYTENADTSTDTCHVTEKGCGTDAEWVDENDREIKVMICEMCDEQRTVVDIATSTDENEQKMNNGVVISSETQTEPIQFYDKSIECTLDGTDGFNGATFTDMATSTETLPYIGLLSNMDCDELILVPEVAIDVIGSDYEYEKIYENSFPVSVAENSAQTEISSATLNLDFLIASETECGPDLIKPGVGNLITVGVNTEHKLTFEKETCTTMYHLLSKGTNTGQIEKTDKATCTGSNVRAIQEALGQSPVPERSTRTPKLAKKDVYVETDPAFLDEKMIACINKLKTVSERLNSPTTKSAPETPWTKEEAENSSNDILLKDLDKVSEKDRKKNVMDLVARTQAMTKTKDTKTPPVRRKAQPLTTLKGRYQGSDGEETKAEQDKPPKSPQPSRPQNSKRNNSAPPRIATVPNQASLRKSPNVPRKTQGVKLDQKSDQSATLPATSKQDKQDKGPESYATVPKTRHPRLPIISESRPSSTGSEASTVSFRSAVSDQRPASTSSDKTLDFSSLKINAPQQRQASVSPAPSRRSGLKDTRSSRATKKPTIEVIPAIDVTRPRTGSSSSDLTDNEPSQEKKGFMKKLFGSKKKKGTDKRNLSPSKSPKPGRKSLAAAPTPPLEDSPKVAPKDKAQCESPKDKQKDKPKPFVYMRSRIFSIEQKDEDKYNKPLVNKYCVDEEKPPVFDFAATFTKK